jgi:hypothetical protein
MYGKWVTPMLRIGHAMAQVTLFGSMSGIHFQRGIAVVSIFVAEKIFYLILVCPWLRFYITGPENP